MRPHHPTPSRHVDLHGVAICECGSLVTDAVHKMRDVSDKDVSDRIVGEGENR